MSTGPWRRALALCYLLPFSAVAGGLILLGALVDRLPLLPASVAEGYRRSMVAAVVGLTRPADWLLAGAPEPVAEPGVRESSP